MRWVYLRAAGSRGPRTPTQPHRVRGGGMNRGIGSHSHPSAQAPNRNWRTPHPAFLPPSRLTSRLPGSRHEPPHQVQPRRRRRRLRAQPGVQRRRQGAQAARGVGWRRPQQLPGQAPAGGGRRGGGGRGDGGQEGQEGRGGEGWGRGWGVRGWGVTGGAGGVVRSRDGCRSVLGVAAAARAQRARSLRGGTCAVQQQQHRSGIRSEDE